MKKQLLSVALCLFVLFVNAQPVITSANGPAIGDVYSSQPTSSNADAGNGGANLVWDFSTITPNGGVLSYTMVDPSTTPYSNHYPAANMASSDGNTYGYYQVTSSEFNLVGLENAVFAYPFSDYQKQVVYPYTYNTTFTDHIHGEWELNTIPTTRDGFVTFLADGYGTLKLPTGTVQNVIRVKYIQDYTDVFTVQSITFTYEYKIVSYSWYVQGNKNALLSVTYDTISLGGLPQISKLVSYYPYTVGISGLLPAVESYSLFPQPASTSASLEYNLAEPGSITVSIVSVTGQIVKQWNQEVVSKGKHTEIIDVTDLALGNYFIRLDRRDKKPVMVKLVKQ